VVIPSRTAWFLALQHVLRFPKYAMAPSQSLLPKFRGRARHHVDVPVSAVSRSSAAPAVWHQSGGIRLASPFIGGSPMQSVIKPYSEPPSLKTQLVSLSTLSHAPRLSSNFIQITTQSRTRSPRNDFVRPAALGRPFTLIRRAPGSPIPINAPDKSSQLQARFVPLHTVSAVQGIMRSDAINSVRFSHRGVSPRAQKMSVKPVNAPLFVSQGPTDTDRARSEPLEAGASPSGTRQQDSPPSASTLHIDGAALGRWTIQHLARALGKPAAGMTGVDPRANIPRNRVQPF
jgi:hypothetical protein